MVLAAGCGFVGFVMGLRILCNEGYSRGQTTCSVFFISGEMAQGGPGRESPEAGRGSGGQASRGRGQGRGREEGGRRVSEKGVAWGGGRGQGGA